ncbi:transposase, partial [Megalodesulfovibrio gigas]
KGGREVQAIGRSRGGLTTKIHAAVDALGNPVRLLLTGGHTHDSVPAAELLQGLNATNYFGDKAYDCNSLIDFIEQRGAVAVIPSKRNRREPRPYDPHMYKE